MKTNVLIRLFGILDVALVGWVAMTAVLAAKIPFITDINRSILTAKEFGGAWAMALSVMPHVGLISVLFSGVYLIQMRRLGGVLSVTQFPFRILFVIQPSLFFVAIPEYNSKTIWVQLAIIITFEFFKLYWVVIWLREKGSFRIGSELR